MARVSVLPACTVAQIGPRVVISTLSIACSLVFSLNLALTPLLAYLSEDFPWTIHPAPSSSYKPFDAFVANVTAYLQAIYNNHTFPYANSGAFLRTPASFCMRHTLTLPPSIADCRMTMLRFPLQLFYGRGIQEFVCAFLASNTTARVSYASNSMCQLSTLLGMPLSDDCIWITPLGNDTYVVEVGTHEHLGPPFAWFKLAFRSGLMLYVSWIVWTSYYIHYRVLLKNLRRVGLPTTSQHGRMKTLVVYMGDPTYFVLSHRFISAFMVLDTWFSASSMSLAICEVGQLKEFWLFLRGYLYISRTVWYAYCVMRWASVFVKRQQWEHKVSSVDPSVLGIGVAIYAGPVFWFIQNSIVSVLFQVLWSIFVPSADQYSTIETIPSLLGVVGLVGSFPVAYSVFHAWWYRRHRSIDHTVSHFASAHYNDFKVKLLWLWLAPWSPSKDRRGRLTHLGGTIQHLIAKQPCHKHLPLFSLRAADCFIGCYDASGILIARARLSLAAGLDRQKKQSDNMAIRICPTQHAHSVGLINNQPCCQAAGPTTTAWLHLGTSDCQWVL
ncbi:Aste57867_10941 [Aphanomyces stellatus]|uniref:Aste57867_10941 protein n=1 Tax=Aphanomyces stellatus TaxID=120398 RepID=A0A485KS68_9STRA|nr:hypothetical protein As57867_010901 [Aphanomyces stellatus]VFT87809.1 Aste57867_10941 [Aphanomyces stellatus]